MSHQTVDALVIGGGFIGNVAALSLAHQGHEVCLIHDGPLPEQAAIARDPWVWALNLRAMARLADCGLVDVGYPFSALSVWQDQQPPWRFSANMVDQAQLGTLAPVGPLQQAAFAAAHAHPNIEWMAHTSLRGQKKVGAKWHYQRSDDCWLLPQVVLATDGEHSMIGKWLGGPLTHQTYQQSCGIALVQAERALQACAYQCFDQGAIAALLPCYEPCCASLVWTLPNAQLAHYQKAPKDFLEAELSRIFSDALGSIALQSDLRWLPIRGYQRQRVAQDGKVLLGRCAQSLHPFLGQATSLSLIELDVLLAQMKWGQGYGLSLGSDAVLARYQRWHRAEHQMAMRLMHALWSTMTHSGGWRSALQRLLRHGAQRPWLRQWAIAWALGKR